MSNFCTHCGKQIVENAVFCSGCGAPIQGGQTQQATQQPAYSPVQTVQSEKKGMGIASLVLGILGFAYAMMAFQAMGEVDKFIATDGSQYIVSFAIGFVLVQSLFALIAFILASVERSKKKNGFNTAGFFLAIATFIMVAVQFIMVIGKA